MQFEKIAVADLRGAEYNPRKKLAPGDAEFEKLKNSILEFGYVEPVIFNKKTGNVVGGHQRLEVLRHLGHTEVDCVVVELDDAKEKALNIALNKIAGHWDEEKLTSLLQELSGGGFDISLTGFEPDELDKLFKGTIDNVQEDNFDEEKELGAIDEPFTKRGDVWQIGRHRLLCGDATDIQDFEKLMGREVASLLLTDPPYNVNYVEAESDRAEYRGSTTKHRPILNDKMSDADFHKFLVAFYKNAKNHMKLGGAFYIFHASNTHVQFRLACDEAGLTAKQTLIWAKQHFSFGRSDYQWQHEPILYGWLEGAPHYFIFDRTQSTILGNKPDFTKMKKEDAIALLEKLHAELSDVIHEDRPMRSLEHPTMKPVTLCARLINNSTRLNEIVIDAFAGSGSTLMAAHQLGRTSYNLELSEHYCDVIVRRALKSWPELEVSLERDGQKIPLDKFKIRG